MAYVAPSPPSPTESPNDCAELAQVSLLEKTALAPDEPKDPHPLRSLKPKYSQSVALLSTISKAEESLLGRVISGPFYCC